jgi:anti-sigma-K factor RskA
MDANEYIETGILELYLMCSLSKAEMLEVEKMIQSNLVVKQEFARIETAVTNIAQHNEIEPRKELRPLILECIEQEARRESVIRSDDKKVHAIQKGSAFYKYLAVASIVLLILSAGANYSFWNKLKTAKDEISSLNSNKEELAQQFNTVKYSYDRSLADISIFRSPNFKTIVMKGLPAMDSTAVAKVYWNKSSKEAYLDFVNLPIPAPDKQYQLWALLDGKPVDAGVFVVNTSTNSLQKMKLVENAQAFAVTLEPRGGSVSPTLTALYVIGNI